MGTFIVVMSAGPSLHSAVCHLSLLGCQRVPCACSRTCLPVTRVLKEQCVLDPICPLTLS